MRAFNVWGVWDSTYKLAVRERVRRSDLLSTRPTSSEPTFIELRVLGYWVLGYGGRWVLEAVDRAKNCGSKKLSVSFVGAST